MIECIHEIKPSERTEFLRLMAIESEGHLENGRAALKTLALIIGDSSDALSIDSSGLSSLLIAISEQLDRVQIGFRVGDAI